MSELAPGSGVPTAVPTHPLDPLSADEIAAVAEAALSDGRLGPRSRFWGAILDEHHARTTGRRRATAVALDPDAHAAWEVDVALDDAGTACAWRAVDPRRPGITSDESRAAAAACRQDPAFRAALARRGIDDPSLVMIDAESIGGFEPPQWADRRLAWGSVWHRVAEEDNGYARPVQGVVPIIDLQSMEVLDVEDHGVLPLPPESGTFRTGDWGPARTDLAPLDIVQPDGPGFTVDGWEVRWQKWRFRVGFTFREGLVLYDVAYEDGDEVRSILKRAAVNEMYVPYMDDSSTQYRKNFFDWGEYGAGQLTSSLALGCDCLGVIHYFDAAFLGADGTVRHIPQAICMHEEDHGILYKHHNSRTGESEVRRSRRLVVSTFVTVANYDYGFYWSFHQDGAIELEVKMTGLLSASGIADGEEPAYGRVVGPNVQTPNHQHYFALRLDAAVDGPLGRLVEVHAEPEPDPARNPYGNAVRTVRTTIASEGDAARDNDPARAVHWRVESAERANRYGEPTAYRMWVDTTTRPFFAPESVAARRAPFVGHHLWATPYDPAERYIGGDYPNQADPGAEGIHVWQRADRPLDGAELVLWPIVGSHHYPRPEDWPVMPAARGFVRLEPDGFFDRNPALDVPAPEHCRHHANGAEPDGR